MQVQVTMADLCREDLIVFMKTLNAAFDAISTLKNKQQACQTVFTTREALLKKERRNKFGVILFSIFFAFFLIVSIAVMTDSTIANPIVILYPILFGIGILAYVVALQKVRNQRLQAEQTLPEARHKIDYYQSLINTISQEADPLFRQFPQGYNTPDALTYMASMLEQKRATTYPEAAAMYDEYAHRRRLENLQESQLNEQRKQTNIQTVQAAVQVIQTAATIKGFSDIKKEMRNRR